MIFLSFFMNRYKNFQKIFVFILQKNMNRPAKKSGSLMIYFDIFSLDCPQRWIIPSSLRALTRINVIGRMKIPKTPKS